MVEEKKEEEKVGKRQKKKTAFGSIFDGVNHFEASWLNFFDHPLANPKSNSPAAQVHRYLAFFAELFRPPNIYSWDIEINQLGFQKRGKKNLFQKNNK